MTNIPEVEERIHENELADGPSNPVAQHVYRGFPKRQSPSGPSLVLGAIALGLVLVLASVFGLWLVRSVRRLNRQVAQLKRPSRQPTRRIQGTEQQTKALAQQASQFGAQAAAPQRDQAKESETTSAAQAQSAHQAEAAAQQGANRGASQAQKEESRNQREEELQ